MLVAAALALTMAGEPAFARDDEQLAAEMQSRMMELEGNVRMLTGRVDELEHRLAETQRAFDNYRADAEMRFQDLGGAPGAAGPNGAGAPASDGGPSSISPPPASGTLPGTLPAPRASLTADPATVATAAAVTLPEGGPEVQYEYGVEKLKAGRYDEARDAFKLFLKANPKHKLAGNAQYWLGETYYVQGKYKDAADSFLKGYTTYSKSSKAPDSLLKLGMTLSALKQKDAACATFGELGRRFPKASEAVVERNKREKKKAGC
jgi:tol-pal system protein YbgF